MSPYEWTFEKSDFDHAGDRFSTFSVGVFQWIPKASGKGLKKSKTIRVKGYVADPESAYGRAAELCKTLNTEKVRLENPPDWLQSQYSVPRPQSLPPTPKRPSANIDASQFRRIRKRVFRDTLEPLGFDVTSSVRTLRSDGSTLRFVGFCFRQFSPQYAIEIGYHYTGLPSIASVNPDRKQIFEHACDYLVNHRVVNHHEYGESPALSERRLRGEIESCLEIIDRLQEAIPTADDFLVRFPPESLGSDGTPPELVRGMHLCTRDAAFVAASHAAQMGDGKLCRAYADACRSHLGQVCEKWERRLRRELLSLQRQADSIGK
jgi:hypothetical protein